MKADLPEREVVGVYIALVPSVLPEKEPWGVYLINDNDFALDDILVNSKGFGEKEGEQVETSTFKTYYPMLEAKSFYKIETMTPEVFSLTNRFWLTFYIDGKIYDKTYLFTPGSISVDYLTQLPVLNEKGILH